GLERHLIADGPGCVEGEAARIGDRAGANGGRAGTAAVGVRLLVGLEVIVDARVDDGGRFRFGELDHGGLLRRSDECRRLAQLNNRESTRQTSYGASTRQATRRDRRFPTRTTPP